MMKNTINDLSKIPYNKIFTLLFSIMGLLMIFQGFNNLEIASFGFFEILGRCITTLELITIFVVFIYKILNFKSLIVDLKKLTLPILLFFGFGALNLYIIITGFLIEGTMVRHIVHLAFFLSIFLIGDHKIYKQLKLVIINTLFVTCFLSLFFMIFLKGFYLNYSGIFFFIPLRLNGLTSHANTLGYVAVAVFIEGLLKKNKKFLVVSILALIFSQSKTCLVIAFLIYAVHVYKPVYAFLKTTYLKQKDKTKLIIKCVCAGLAVIFLVIFFLKFNFTLTGRTNIWAYGFKAWFENISTVFFGSGEYLYYRGEGVTALRQAHNQFIHNLTCNGLIGFTLISLIFFAIFRDFWKNNRKSKSYLYVLTLLFLRCMTEASLITVQFDFAGLVCLYIFLTFFISKNINKVKNDKTIKKVLFIHHGSSNAGAPRSLKFLIEQLDLTKFEPHILCITDKRGNYNLFKSLNAKFYFERRMKPFHGSTVAPENWKLWVLNVLGAVPTYFLAQKYVEDINPDIVHLNSTCLCMAAAGIRGINSEIPIVCHVREPLRTNIMGSTLRVFNKASVSQFVSIDEYDKNTLKNKKVPSEVVYNFVNFKTFDYSIEKDLLREKFNISKDNLVFLYLARVASSNGALEMVKALENNTLTNCSFVIAGFNKNDEYEKEVLEISKNIPNVYTMGFSDDVVGIIASSDVMVVPFQEPHFARAIVEAGAMKVPSIASDIEGPQELVINEKTGLLFDYKDMNNFVKACERISNDNDLFMDMRENAYQFAYENFEAVKNSQRVFDIYDKLINNKKSLKTWLQNSTNKYNNFIKNRKGK